jgi:hypothetical protein
LLGSILPTVITIGYSEFRPLRHHLRAEAAVILLLTALPLCLWVWGIVGIIRSANRHTSRGGKLLWANVARVMVCISVIATGIQLQTHLLPESRLMASLAAGHDPLDMVTVEATPDGRTIMLDGTLGEGSIDKVQRVIDASPDATTLVLNSDGGRETAAEELALRVRQRHLNTLVQDHCLSACTFVFLAGIKREVADDADLGFHQGTADGLSAMQKSILIQRMVDLYRSQGVREWFIDRIVATPPASMWYPTKEELTRAGVIN